MLTVTASIGDAERVFHEPAHVLDSEELATEDKIRIVENWKLDLIELQTASQENMPGGNAEPGKVGEKLRAVMAALRAARDGTDSSE